ncbi:MAG: hypothetical protein AB1942_03665 [Pseudomonadota bacterium]
MARFRALIRAVPDGWRDAPSGGRLANLSLVVLPHALADPADLKRWPRHVAGQPLTVWTRGRPGSPEYNPPTPQPIQIRIAPPPNDALAMWERIFEGQFDVLKQVLEKDQGPGATREAAEAASATVRSYDGDELASAIESAVYGEAATSLAAGIGTQRATFAGVKPFGGAIAPGGLAGIRTMLFADEGVGTPIGELLAARGDETVGGVPGRTWHELLGHTRVSGDAVWAKAISDAYKGSAPDYAALKKRFEDLRIAVPAGAPRDRMVQVLAAQVMTDPDTWQKGALADPVLKTHVQALVARYRLAVRSISRPPRDPVSIEDAVRRKLTGILAQPGLARYLGLVADAYFAQPRDATPFLVAVTEKDLPGGALEGSEVWSAARWVDKLGLLPATRAELGADEAGREHVDGLLNLRAAALDGSGTPRFAVTTLQQRTAIEALGQQAKAALATQAQGAATSASPRLPELRTAGLALIDRSRKQAVEREINQNKSRDRERIVYSEDLLVGYRIDVGLQTNGGVVVWRSLVEREVEYFGVTATPLDGSVPPQAAGRDARREHGYVRPLVQEGTDAKEVIAFQTIVTWPGGSLAVSSGPSKAFVTDPAIDLAASVTRRIPDAAKPGTTQAAGDLRGLMPLRFGRSYHLGVRLAFQNGAGLSLTEAEAQYRTRTTITDAVTFRRFEEIQSPTPLVVKGDPLLGARKRGDTMTQLVVRGAGAIQRKLKPPAVTSELVGYHGVADGLAALPGAILATELAATVADLSGVQQTATEGADSQVAKYAYYPDPLAEMCCFALVREGRAPGDLTRDGGAVASTAVVEMNPRGEWPRKARLVNLTVKGGDRWPRAQMRSDEKGVTVDIAPGEEFELWCWSAPRAQVAFDEHRFFEGVRQVAIDYRQPSLADGDLTTAIAASEGADDDAPASDRTDAFDALISQLSPRIVVSTTSWNPEADGRYRFAVAAPRAGLATATVFRLVNPVERPAAPRFEANGQRSLNAVRLLKAPTTAPDAKESLALWQGFLKDYKMRLGQVGATRSYFAGELQVDRAATGRVRLEGMWEDFSDDVAVVRGQAVPGGTQEAGWTFRSLPRRAELIAFDNDQRTVRRSDGYGDVVLNVDGSGAERLLSFDFGDARARRMDVRIIARSRYTEFYEPAEGDLPDRFESASADTRELWVPATVRPPPPILRGPEVLPLFRFRTVRTETGFDIERDMFLRIYLERPWYESGQGELLALVCGSAKLFGKDSTEQAQISRTERDRPVSALDGNRVEPFVTRRGHDPIYSSGRLSRWLIVDNVKVLSSADGVLRTPVLRNGLSLPYRPEPTADDPNPTPASELVSIFGFEPNFDERTGTWRCDAFVDPDQAYAPFLRLSLARYQEQAIAGQELSEPAVTWAKLAPRRRMSVTFVTRDGKRVVRLAVRGQGYFSANAGELDVPRVHVPSLRVTLMKSSRSGGAGGWTAWPDEDEDTITPYEKLAAVDTGEAVWSDIEFTLPAVGADERLGLLVTEFGYMAADGEPGEKDQLRMSHRTFVSLIDLQTGMAWSRDADQAPGQNPAAVPGGENPK